MTSRAALLALVAHVLVVGPAWPRSPEDPPAARPLSSAAKEPDLVPVEIRVRGEGSGRRFSMLGTAAAIDLLRGVTAKAGLVLEEPDPALEPFLASRVFCELEAFELLDVCTMIAGSCGLVADLSDEGALRVTSLREARSTNPMPSVEESLDRLGKEMERLSASDGACPIRPNAALALANAWLAKGNVTQAAAAFASVDTEATRAAPPARRLARLGLARCDVASGRAAAGFATAERLLAESGADEAGTGAALLLVREAVSRDDGPTAVERLSTVMAQREIDRDFLDVVDAALRLCRDGATRRVAIASFDRALEGRPATPGDAHVRLRLALLADSAGDSRTTVREADLAVRLDPLGAGATTALRLIARAIAASSPARALLMLEAARGRAKDAESIAIALDLARLYLRAGVSSLAIERFVEAGAQTPSDDPRGPVASPGPTAELAEVYLELGQSARAGQLFAALAVTPGFESAGLRGIVRSRLALEDVGGALDAVRDAAPNVSPEAIRAALAAIAPALARSGDETAALAAVRGVVPTVARRTFAEQEEGDR